MIYLDNAASTKVNPQVLETLNYLYDKYYFNANSPFFAANQINQLQEQSRSTIKKLLNTDEELIFTSSGSESNNLALKGVMMRFAKRKDIEIITSKLEHASVYNTIIQLQELFDFKIVYVDNDQTGQIDYEHLLSLVNHNTALVCVMKVNSELGTINYIEDYYDQIKQINSHCLVFSDCVQALGKVKINLDCLDLASFSAHKINGLKGSGLLYKKRKVKLIPLINGGAHEFGLRGGTSNYHYNIVLAKTIRLYLDQDNTSVKQCFKYLCEYFSNNSNYHINSDINNNSNYILNICVIGYKVEVICNELERNNIYVSTQSACSLNVKGSRVLSNLNIDHHYQKSSIRLSLSPNSTLEEMKLFTNTMDEILITVTRGN